MESENELNPIDIKNHACYYFDHIMRVIHFNSRDILLNKKNLFMALHTLHTKLLWVRYHCVLG